MVEREFTESILHYLFTLWWNRDIARRIGGADDMEVIVHNAIGLEFDAGENGRAFKQIDDATLKIGILQQKALGANSGHKVIVGAAVDFDSSGS